MTIRFKMLATMLGIACLAVLISGYISDLHASRGLTDAALRQLTGIRRSKAQQIETQFATFRTHARTLSADTMLIAAMREFRESFRKEDGRDASPERNAALEKFYRAEYLTPLSALMPLRSSIADYVPVGGGPSYVQSEYLVRNPFPRDQRYRLDDAKDGSQYSRAHAKYHPALLRIASEFGYRDLLLIDSQTGRIVYSVAKKPDIGTDLVRGPYRETALARAFRACREAPDVDTVCLADFEAYEPSLGAPAAFLVSPIDDRNLRSGVLAFQLSIDEIDRVASGNHGWEKDGLGRTGDTGIVGPDFLMRTNSRGFIENPEEHVARLRARGTPEERIRRIQAFRTSALEQEVRLPSVIAALSGKEGAGVQLGSAGGRSLVSYGPLQIPGLHWTIASRMDEAEALAAAHAMRSQLILWTVATIILASLVATLATRALVRPIQRACRRSQETRRRGFERRRRRLRPRTNSAPSPQPSMGWSAALRASADLAARQAEELRSQQQILRESEAKFRTMYESSSDALMLLDEKRLSGLQSRRA